MQYFEMSNADISRNSSFMQNEHIFNIILHFFFLANNDINNEYAS